MKLKLRPHHFQTWIDGKVFWRVLLNPEKSIADQMGQEYFDAFIGCLDNISRNSKNIEVEFIEDLDCLCMAGPGCKLIDNNTCSLDKSGSGARITPRQQDEIIRRGYGFEMHRPYDLALLVKSVFPIIEEYALQVEFASANGRLKTDSNYDLLQEVFRSFGRL
jgi:hypothetical protein